MEKKLEQILPENVTYNMKGHDPILAPILPETYMIQKNEIITAANGNYQMLEKQIGKEIGKAIIAYACHIGGF